MARLAGKLRDTRSLVTEQTYIEGLTQAAESARIARNQLRCTQLEDISACRRCFALQARSMCHCCWPKGDALLQANRPADAVAGVPACLSQLKPGDETVKTKLAECGRR